MTFEYCKKCGHSIAAHYHLPMLPKGCHVRGCNCKNVHAKGK